jgi:hypothetical protein
VPDCRLPNSGDAYQLLCHACPSPPLMTPDAVAGWSPSDVPSGPYATADAAVSKLPVTAPGAGLEVALAPVLEVLDRLGLGAGAADRADAAAVARGIAEPAVPDADGRPADATPPEIRS